jgi:hypothetical protein
MRETELPDGTYEQRFGVAIGSVSVGRFVRRPVSIIPPDGTVCFVDEGERYGTIKRRDGALFKEGRWQRTKLTPTHWWEIL